MTTGAARNGAAAGADAAVAAAGLGTAFGLAAQVVAPAIQIDSAQARGRASWGSLKIR